MATHAARRRVAIRTVNRLLALALPVGVALAIGAGVYLVLRAAP